MTFPVSNDRDEWEPRAAASRRDTEAGLFTEAEIASLSLPDGYRRSITTWFDLLRTL